MLPLYKMAAALGVIVIDGDPGRGRKGCYIDTRRTIVLRPGMGYARTRYVLGHELGHAVRRDVHTGNADYDERAERRADEFAARLLIHPDAVRSAESIYGTDLESIARDLDVPTELLAVWRGLHQRISVG